VWEKVGISVRRSSRTTCPRLVVIKRSSKMPGSIVPTMAARTGVETDFGISCSCAILMEPSANQRVKCDFKNAHFARFAPINALRLSDFVRKAVACNALAVRLRVICAVAPFAVAFARTWKGSAVAKISCPVPLTQL
jgi:hypothetical protein